MKELTREVVKREVYGYEANDGKIFDSKEECEKYEKSSDNAIFSMFMGLMVDEPFHECSIYEDFGYGSEEFSMCVIRIENENDLKIANMYYESKKAKNNANDKKFTSEMIGKRILVNLGYDYDEYGCYVQGTFEELKEKFVKKTERFFMTKEEKQS